VGKGDLNAAPGIIGGSQVTRDNRGDHSATTAPLWAGLEPSAICPVSTGETVCIREVAAAQSC